MTGKNQAPLAALRSVALATKRTAEERCDLCSVGLYPRHRHLLEVATRRIFCACDPCALRFENVLEGRFTLIPRDTRVLPEFRMTGAQWDNLSIPINLAFLFFSTPNRKMTALYPSPAGVTESLLPLSQWQALVSENPALAHLQPDVEALLVNRVGAERDYFIAPVDVCFELAGLIRMHWRGLSGGEVVWREIARFFDRLKAESNPWREPGEPSHA